MKKIWLAFQIILFTTLVNAQPANLEWVRPLGSIYYDGALSVCTDAFGNVYTTGHFIGVVDFDPGIGTLYLSSNFFNADFFIQKLDNNGNLIWAKSIGGTSVDKSRSITIDISGNVYITGHYQDTVDFDPGIGVFTLTSNGYWDIFILKLDSNGNFIWAKSVGGISGEEGSGITTDTLGNVYIAGMFADTVDFDPGIGIFTLTANGGADIFIQKLDSIGNLIWAKSVGGWYHDMCYSITIDAQGNTYSTGYFRSTVDFNPGVGVFNLTSNGQKDIFIQKLDTNGDFIWARSVGGESNDVGLAINLDNWGDVYATGYFEDTVDFDPGPAIVNQNSHGLRDIFILKLDTSGYFKWSRSFGDVNYDIGTSIVTDTLRNVYVTGSFSGMVDFDPGAGTSYLTTNGNHHDILVLELNAMGNHLMAKSMGGNWYDTGNSITLDENESIFIAGSFRTTADFDPNSGTHILLSNGEDDAFVLKLNRCPSDTIIDVISACDSLLWIDGFTYTANNDSATYNLSTAAGCDSIVMLNLTINNPSTGVDVINACNSFTWIDGITYTSSDSSATHTLTNVGGCDSVVTLNLTINNVDVGVTTINRIISANATGATYQWLDCNNNFAVINGETAQTFTATANGDYAVEVSQNGCTDTTVCVTISSLDINENLSFNDVYIIPNPTQGLVNIELGSLTDVDVKVYNVNGQLIYYAANINTSTHQFELNEVPGIYIVEVSSQEEKQHYKLIKK